MPITGRNAKRVLFGAIDLRSARRVVLIRSHAGQADAQAFLRTLRRRYRRAGWLWLLTDRASAHTAPQTQALATRLRIRFVWLPRQAPELSPMDQLWRDLKRLIAANRQAASIDALAADAAAWVLTLTPHQARRKAGMASKRFWLRKLMQNFWQPRPAAWIRRDIGAPMAPMPITTTDRIICVAREPSDMTIVLLLGNRHATVDGKYLAGDDPRLIRSKIDGHVRDIGRLRQSQQVTLRKLAHCVIAIDHGPDPCRERDARCDRIHPNRITGVFSGHGSCKRYNTTFGSSVTITTGYCHQGDHRRHIDHRSSAGLNELGQAVLATEEHSVEIDPDRPPELVVRHLGHRSVLSGRASGHVAQHIEVAKCIYSLCNRSAYAFTISDIATKGDRIIIKPRGRNSRRCQL